MSQSTTMSLCASSCGTPHHCRLTTDSFARYIGLAVTGENNRHDEEPASRNVSCVVSTVTILVFEDFKPLILDQRRDEPR